MSYSGINITEPQIVSAVALVLGYFGMTDYNGNAIPIIKGQVNRVPTPPVGDYAVIWPIMRNRLATNYDWVSDAQITGSVAGNLLTVGTVLSGQVIGGTSVYQIGSAAGLLIMSQKSGTPGGVGVYVLAGTGSITSQTLYVGSRNSIISTEIVYQVDIHGAASADNATRLATLFRDQFAVDQFAATGIDLSPLYADDPRQIAFDNAEDQTEFRWSVDLHMQANIAITTGQQFADTLTATATPLL